MDKRLYTCCFTGHRELPAGREGEIWRHVLARLEPLMDQGVRYFGVGGALGFDMLAAEEFLALRDRGRCLKVILVLPFPGYRRYWLPAQEERAARVEARADKVVWCSREPSREAFLLRNRRLVDGSAYCIAYCTRPYGGSAYTLRYAQKQGLRVWNIGEMADSRPSSGGGDGMDPPPGE